MQKQVLIMKKSHNNRRMLMKTSKVAENYALVARVGADTAENNLHEPVGLFA